MKVLFVCRSNVKRSQAAMGFYNQLVPGQGVSAGIIVGTPGEKLKDRFGKIPIMTVMKEHGVDISENVRTQLTQDVLNDYEKVVVMAQPETIPEWLANSPKVVIWTVRDVKGDVTTKSLDETRAMAAEIKSKVEELIESKS